MVQSKYNRLQLTIIIFATLLFVTGSLSILSKSQQTPKAFFGGLASISLAVYLPIIFFRRAPFIKFDENFITFKGPFLSGTYSWEQVTNVILTTQEDYSALFIFSYKMEAMKLSFEDKSALIIWGDMYRNMRDLRHYAANKLNDKIHFIAQRKEREYGMSPEKKYFGNPFTSFNTIMIIGMAIFFAVTLSAKAKNIWFVPVGVVLLFYFLFSTQMYFFEIKDQKLIVRNHYFPWLKTIYNLDDIEEVSTETPYRRSTGLRIITYQFKSKLYCAGSLRNHTWKELLDDLKSIGIKVN